MILESVFARFNTLKALELVTTIYFTLFRYVPSELVL